MAANPPTGRPTRVRVALLALAVALVLAANAFVLVLDGSHADLDTLAGSSPTPTQPDAAPPTAPTTSSAPEPTTTTASSVPTTPLERRVAELSAFVADQRELEFKRPVTVQLLGDDAFVDRLLRDVEENREDTDASEKLLRALRLIEPGVDLFESYLDYYAGAVLGFYDPRTDELVVRGGELNPYIETTLVHELAHALEDQYFELNRPEIDDADDERALAFSSLIEGVAITVQTAYQATLSVAETEASNREAAASSQRRGTSSIPAIINSLSQFPYLAGPFFVGALVEEGAEGRVNEAFRNPPTTSEEILDPEVYLRGEAPVPVAPPRGDGPVVDEGAFGQWALTLTLQAYLDTDVAYGAADGWGGDAYVAWDAGGGRTCVRMTFAMDTPADLAELDSAWRTWATSHGDTTVDTTADRVTVTACG